MTNLRPLVPIAALVAAAMLVCAAQSPTPQANLNPSARTQENRPLLVAGVTSPLEAAPTLRAPVARPVSIVKARPAAVSAPARPGTIQHSTTPPPPTGDGYTGSVAALIRSTFGSDSGCALRIAWRESRFNPRAQNPRSSASGIFQLVRLWWDGRWHFDPFNAWLNVHYAHEMVQMYGFAPWGGC